MFSQGQRFDGVLVISFLQRLDRAVQVLVVDLLKGVDALPDLIKLLMVLLLLPLLFLLGLLSIIRSMMYMVPNFAAADVSVVTKIMQQGPHI